MKKNKKNILIYLSILLVVLSFYNKSKKGVSNKSSHEYLTCSKRNVYICNSLDEAKELSLNCNEQDVLIVDQTSNKDPNVKILSSYKITDREDMIDILNTIKEYFSNNENSWDRSIYSMENEWIIHNICSNMSFLNARTDDVDLNNRDEKLYNSKIIGRIIGNKSK